MLLDSRARIGALSVLARQYPGAETAAMCEARVRDDRDLGLRRAALALAAQPGRDAAIRAAVAAQATDHASLCTDGARLLGRYRAEAEHLKERFARLTSLSERVHLGLALAKLHDESIEPALRKLVIEDDDRAEALSPATAMPLACAIAMLAGGRGETASRVADLFKPPLQPFALRAARSAAGELDRMAPIPAGQFMMGAAEGEAEALPREYPQHLVTVSAFEMGVFAVTFEEYDLFCEATGRSKLGDHGWGRERRPVIDVSWEDAHAYCDWLYEWSGERFRLPSEAEWEYACRAGTTTPFSFGDTISTEQANYDGNYIYGGGRKGEYRQRTTPVGEFPANAFGLHDMHGNVWEWCADAWNDTYDDNPPSDGAVWLTGGADRVLRGGSWFSLPRRLRSADRSGVTPILRLDDVGFRLARTRFHP